MKITYLKLIFFVTTFFVSQKWTLHGSTQYSELSGMVANKCSGAIVDIGRREHDYAVILTNGHCTRHSALPPGIFVQNEKYVRSEISVFNNQGQSILIQPRNVLYGTMEGGDLGLIEISHTYSQLRALGVRIFELSTQDSEPEEVLFTASGYWKTSQTCIFSHNVLQLLEGDYQWSNAMAMEEACKIKGGWSGSPLISKISGQIVGVINTSNMNGERCTLNNPCENNYGRIMVARDRTYGVHTAILWSCLTNGKVDLNKPGCRLFHRKKLKNPDDEHLSPEQKVEWLRRLTQEYPSKKIDIEVANYDMTHMSTSLVNRIFVNKTILTSYSLLELIFFTCHELGHHFGDKKVTVYPDIAIEAEADYFAGSCFSQFSLKWENPLRPYLNLYETANYPRCGGSGHCNKNVEIIKQSYSLLFGASVSPDRALQDKFPNGINKSYPDANCRALSAVSGLLRVERPLCWFNP